MGKFGLQKLKLSKLTVIWYSRSLLYPYFEFNVYFFKIFAIQIFLVILVPKSEALQINWNLIQGYIAICIITILTFVSSKLFWDKSSPKLTEIWYRDTLLYAYYDFNVYYFKNFVPHIILGKFCPKKWYCPNLLESSICVYFVSTFTELHHIFMLHFSKYREQ